MSTINVSGAPERLVAIGKLTGPGLCLHYVDLALKAPKALTPAGIAMDVWNYCPPAHRHPGDGSDAPYGAVIVLGPRTRHVNAADPDGDVIIAKGDRKTAAATDTPATKRTGWITIAQRSKNTVRPVLGWVDMFLGHQLVDAAGNPLTSTTTATAGDGATLIQEDDMSAAAEAQIQAIHDMLVNGQQPQLNVAKFDQALNGVLDIQSRMMAATGGQWDAFDELIKNTRATLALAGKSTQGAVDVDALAASIRQGLGDEIANTLAARLAAPTK